MRDESHMAASATPTPAAAADFKKTRRDASPSMTGRPTRAWLFTLVLHTSLPVLPAGPAARPPLPECLRGVPRRHRPRGITAADNSVLTIVAGYYDENITFERHS